LRAASVAIAVAASIAMSAVGAGATAQGGGAVEEALEDARRAEAEARPRDARDAWQRVVAAAPTSRQAARARQRVAWLEERSEGDFAPLAILMRARARPAGERDAAAIAALEEGVDRMPVGRVRIEARQLVASEWLRLGAPERATRASRALLEEPGLRPSDRALAREQIARWLEAEGRSREAIVMLEESGLEGSFVHTQIRGERRRAVVVPIAVAMLAVFVLGAIAIAAPGLRRDPRGVLGRGLAPSRLAMIGWATLIPAVIARAYDHEATDTFALLALGCGAVIGIASIGGASCPPRRPRIALVVLTVLATLAVAYLVGDREASLLGFVSGAG
jgi:hypothetical protein